MSVDDVDGPGTVSYYPSYSWWDCSMTKSGIHLLAGEFVGKVP